MKSESDKQIKCRAGKFRENEICIAEWEGSVKVKKVKK